jgi:hypothetical protein
MTSFRDADGSTLTTLRPLSFNIHETLMLSSWLTSFFDRAVLVDATRPTPFRRRNISLRQ